MKVAIKFTIEIDSEAWQLNYGCYPEEVRKDVKEYMEGMCRQQVASLELGFEDEYDREL